MSIKYAVLGLITEEPRHGYAVRAAFEERLGDFWELNFGQVYQVLTSLESEGFIVGTDERIGRRPPRTVYAATAKGRDALRRWLQQPIARKQPFRDEFFVRLLFASQSDTKLIATMLERQVALCRERLSALTEERDRCVASNSDDVRQLFREAAILHAEADLKALGICQNALMPTASARARERVAAPRVGRAGSVR